jgi:RNA binding exosome subunit
MLAHFIELSVFSTPEDDEEQVYRGFLSFLPFDPAKEKVSVKKTHAEGFNDRRIVVYKVTLTKQRHINSFLESLFGRLSAEQRQLLERQKESRLDDNLYFFIRIDKARLIEEGKAWITDCGTCYHIKIALAPFPRKRELALKLVDELLALSQIPVS